MENLEQKNAKTSHRLYPLDLRLYQRAPFLYGKMGYRGSLSDYRGALRNQGAYDFCASDTQISERNDAVV